MPRLAALILITLGLAVPAAGQQPPDDWAYKPVAKPDVPAVKDRATALTPIDAFLLARLEPRGLTFAARGGLLVIGPVSRK